MTTQFETGKKYAGRNTFTVLSKTEKTITIDDGYWGAKRLKLRNYGDGCESITYRSECITSNDFVN